MKSHRIPPTDVANFAALDTAAKWKALTSFRKPRVHTVSYASFRGRLADCLGLAAGVFPVGRVDRDLLERLIIADCGSKKTPVNIGANLQVARGVLTLADTLNIGGAAAPELSPRMMGGHIVDPWNRLALNIREQLVVPFFDPRRTTSRLSPLGMQVAFSIMHENIRAVHPDFADARLAIVQFAEVDGDERPATVHYDDQVDLFSYDDLVRMISELHRIYDAVCAGHEEDARRHADDKPEDDLAPLEKVWRKA